MKKLMIYLAILFLPIIVLGQIDSINSINGWRIIGWGGSITKAYSKIISGFSFEGNKSQEFFIEAKNYNDGSWLDWEKTYPTPKVVDYVVIYFSIYVNNYIPSNSLGGIAFYFSLGKNEKYYPFSLFYGFPYIIKNIWYQTEGVPQKWNDRITFDKIKIRMKIIEATSVSFFIDNLQLYVGVNMPPILTDRMGDDVVGIVDEPTLPTSFKLFQNYPNPFNPTTIIKYEISSIQNVNITVYDILGRKVTTLVNEKKLPGSYEVKFNALNLPSGIYYYQLIAGNYISTKKMQLIK